VRPDELERRLRERLDALGPAPRAELLHVLMLLDLDRVAAASTVKGIETGDALLEGSGLHIVDQGEPVTVPCGDTSLRDRLPRQVLDVAAISEVATASMNRLPNAGDRVTGRIKERVVLEAESSVPDDEGSPSICLHEQAPVLLNQDALHNPATNVSPGVPRGEEQPFFHRRAGTRCREHQSNRQAEVHGASVASPR
jgi:hypothetical protein